MYGEMDVRDKERIIYATVSLIVILINVLLASERYRILFESAFFFAC